MKQGYMLAALAAATLAIPIAGGPRFVRVSPSMQDSNLVVEFTMAGIEPGAMQTVGLIGRAKAVYGCITQGDPAGQKATDIRTKTRANTYQQGTFQASDRGTLNEVMGFSAPAIDASENCPNSDHRVVLVSSEFTNVRILDISNSTSRKIPGTFRKVLFGVQ